MRFYAIQIGSGIPQADLASITGFASNPSIVASQAAQPVPAAISAVTGGAVGGAQWCSVINGQNDPGALDVEFDIQLFPSGVVQNGWVKIYGIPQSLIAQSSYFTGCMLTLYGGFTDGLPLATLEAPHQGKLVDALIWPCIGNWIGNELSLTFILQPSSGNPGGPTDPVNIVHNMPKGTTLASAIQGALSTAFPKAGLNIQISNNLTLNYDDHGYYQSIEQYMDYVKTLSHSIMGGTQTGYLGVRADTSQSMFNIFDGTVPGSTVQLLFEDLIGQPAWVGPSKIQVKTALRADIRPNNSIVLPQNILTTTTFAGAQAFLPGQPWVTYQPGDVLNFQGEFQVLGVRHLGRFRNPNAENNWVTIIDAQSGGSLIPTAPNVTNQSGQQTFTPSGAASGSGGGIGMQ